MQTGTTPARRIVTEPAGDRSASPTGPCRIATTTPVGPTAASPPATSAGIDRVGFAEVVA